MTGALSRRPGLETLSRSRHRISRPHYARFDRTCCRSRPFLSSAETSTPSTAPLDAFDSRVTSSMRFTAAEIRRLLNLLDAELAADDAEGEVYLVGGAVMCLALQARDSTRDLDAIFRPTRVVRQ